MGRAQASCEPGSQIAREFGQQPAIGGCVAVECRADDGSTLEVLSAVDHPRTRHSVEAERAFLREIRDGACDLFRVVLGPDYNAAHRDHFHLDMGAFRACR